MLISIKYKHNVYNIRKIVLLRYLPALDLDLMPAPSRFPNPQQESLCAKN